MDADRVINTLGLEPLDQEGGFFREVYRSTLAVSGGAVERRHGGPRTACTSIYYFLRPGTRSAMHRVKSDEIFHFYRGDPVEILILEPGNERVETLGPAFESGQKPMVIVPAGCWQGAVLAEPGEWALTGTTVAPGFEYKDFEIGDVEELAGRFPKWAEHIRARAPADEG